MEEEKNIFNNMELLDTLFDYSNKEDDILYKNDIYSPLIEEQYKQEIPEKNKIEITRDKILQKLSLEEYSPFPPKNDSLGINLNEKGKEDQEKLSEEEIDYLHNINKLNYLAFSPFGTSFFPDLNSINKTEEKNDQKEKEILNIIDFDYNNYEINNDLLFNIGMGFIDINKLQLENVITSDKKAKLKNKKTKKNLIENITSNENNNSIIQEKKENEDNNEISDSKELNTTLMEEINGFIENNKNISFYKDIFKEFNKELSDLEKSEDIDKENEALEKWKIKFEKKKKSYKLYLIKEEEKKKKEKEEEKIRKETEMKLEKERLEKINKEKELFKELEQIRIKSLRKMKNKKEFTYFNKNYIKRNLLTEKGKNKNNTINNDKTYRDRAVSSDPLREKDFYSKINNDKIRINNKKHFSLEKEERCSYLRRKNNYYFFQDY